MMNISVSPICAGSRKLLHQLASSASLKGGGKPALFNICSQRCPSASLNAHFLEVQVGFCLTIHGMQGGEGLLALGRAERPAVSSSS